MELEYVNGVHRFELTDCDKLLLSKGERYQEYLAQFRKASSGILPGKPMYIVLETNNYCNMRCKMCVRGMNEKENDQHTLPMPLIDKLFREMEEMDVPGLFLGGGAECLINPEIKNIINKIRSTKRTVTDDVLITNGYELSDEVIRLLIDLQWEKLFVSLDAASPETYKKIRGRDLAHVEQRVNRFLEIRAERGSHFPILRVSFVIMDENKEEQETFFEKWKNKADIIDFQRLAVYSENMEPKRGLPDPIESCLHPFSRLEIDTFGNIYPCCSEWQRYYRLGNIADITIKEAWTGEKISQLRKALEKREFSEICKNCLSS